ncbi:uncharacterized protein BDR25DRAFT_358497 [Lindgomyces ingoldianus]|uniref:Uncharacterized protein n=1 Tax=Lindgomyces ingoldianus TaxID=673940 RepID=A0ACB6QKJ4_9PLEO|nr:uncharacterized protein BDR25DRAFT_358497 [Lindgomyces ingoldianus]KAF2467387.1 hypothetical protein BDR25DRAFT_358497 [Lindgomyces ingoldianus]
MGYCHRKHCDSAAKCDHHIQVHNQVTGLIGHQGEREFIDLGTLASRRTLGLYIRRMSYACIALIFLSNTQMIRVGYTFHSALATVVQPFKPSRPQTLHHQPHLLKPEPSGVLHSPQGKESRSGCNTEERSYTTIFASHYNSSKTSPLDLSINHHLLKPYLTGRFIQTPSFSTSLPPTRPPQPQHPGVQSAHHVHTPQNTQISSYPLSSSLSIHYPLPNQLLVRQQSARSQAILPFYGGVGATDCSEVDMPFCHEGITLTQRASTREQETTGYGGTGLGDPDTCRCGCLLSSTSFVLSSRGTLRHQIDLIETTMQCQDGDSEHYLFAKCECLIRVTMCHEDPSGCSCRFIIKDEAGR